MYFVVDLLPDGDVRERDVTAPGSPEYAHVSALSVLSGCSTTGKPTRSFATERVSLDSV
jgi:hypothetical protein